MVIPLTTGNRTASSSSALYDTAGRSSSQILPSSSILSTFLATALYGILPGSWASLTITVKNKETEARETFPLLLKNNFYEVNLSSLEAGEYDYTVSVSNEVLSASGSFTIIDFNVEQQFLNANVAKLERISIATGGKTFFIDNFEDIVTNFTTDNRYIPIQKSEQKVVPLIDWKYLLFLIVMLLAVEWFSRKYNGLI